MEVVRDMGNVITDLNDRPRLPITIFGTGEFNDSRIHIREDQFLDTFQQPNEATGLPKPTKYKRKKIMKVEGTSLQEQSSSDSEQSGAENKQKKVTTSNSNLIGITEEEKTNLGEKMAQKLLDLRMKMNQAANENNRAIVEENERWNDPKYEKKRRAREWVQNEKEKKNTLQIKGMKQEKLYLADPASKCLKQKRAQKQKQKKVITFGWEVFNEDSLYKAYYKRTKNLELDRDQYEKAKIKKLNDGTSESVNSEEIPEEKLDLLVKDLERQNQKKRDFSRKRMLIGEKDVYHINERNRRFNQKIERNYGKFAAEIKANLERGTAI